MKVLSMLYVNKCGNFLLALCRLAQAITRNHIVGDLDESQAKCEQIRNSFTLTYEACSFSCLRWPSGDGDTRGAKALQEGHAFCCSCRSSMCTLIVVSLKSAILPIVELSSMLTWGWRFIQHILFKHQCQKG
jgi:hypothetical protein